MTSAPRAAPRPRPGRHPGFRSGTSLWLFRHGEVHPDWQGLAYGGLDAPLSEEGERETRELARAFARVPFRAILCSPLQRAVALGRELATNAGLPLLLRPGLVEIDRGAWQGLKVSELFATREAEVAALYADPWSYSAHGGETDADVLARAWPVVEEAVAPAREVERTPEGDTTTGEETATSTRGEVEHARGSDSVALACHYNVIRVLVAHALGVAPENSFRLRVDLLAACLLEDGPEGWTLARFNVKNPADPAAAQRGPP